MSQLLIAKRLERGEHAGDRAFHVGAASPVKPVTDDRRFERTVLGDGPVLGRHDVGVPKVSQAAAAAAAAFSRDDVGLGNAIVVDVLNPLGLATKLAECLLAIIDDVPVRSVPGRVESDEVRGVLQRVHF